MQLLYLVIIYFSAHRIRENGMTLNVEPGSASFIQRTAGSLYLKMIAARLIKFDSHNGKRDRRNARSHHGAKHIEGHGSNGEWRRG